MNNKNLRAFIGLVEREKLSIDISYFRHNDDLSMVQKNKFIKILKQRLDDGALAMRRNVIVDCKAVSGKVNMDCMNCHKIRQFCCCDGSPCYLIREEADAVIENMWDIVSTRFDKETLNEMMTYGTMYEQDDLYVPRDYEHGCAFLMTADDGRRLCAIKNWCIENDIDIVGVCPTSCLLFPMDILVISYNDEEYFYVTSVFDVEYRKNIIRWGSDTGENYECLGDGEVPQEFKGKIFKKSGFIPLYKEMKELLISWFDVETYNFIEKNCKSMEV